MGQRPWRGLVLALMLISLVTPVQADGEGIGMDAAQLPVSVDVDDSPLLSVHLVGFGVNGTAMLHASISDAEGSVVWSAMDNATLGGGDAAVLVLNLSTVPTGVQQLELVLSGHVMASNATHVSSATVTLQRDRPLSVGVVTASSDRVESLNAAGAPTGAYPRDGDRMAWFITLRNDGDVAWNGTLQSTFAQGPAQEIVNASVSLSPMNTSEVVMLTSTSWSEGEIDLSAVLVNLTDVDSSDDEMHWNTTVAPPPLPLLTLTAERQNTPDAPGEAWRHNLSLSNTGQASWAGAINCTWSDGSLHDSLPVNINIAETLNMQAEGPAKDGTLSCEAVGPRMDDASQAIVVDVLDLPTAVFEVVAGGQPVPLDGPWDVGDEVRWSAVVRNIGTRGGTVALEVADGNDRHASDPVTLATGEAAELSVAHPLTRAGDVAWSWALMSDDGVLTASGGTANLLIMGPPTLTSTIEQVEVDDQLGHVVEWNISLASSTSRLVTIEVGHGVQGAWTWASSTTLELDANALSGSTTLGWIESENVAVRVTPIDWVHEGGPLLVSAATAPTRAELSLLLKPTTVPVDPVAGGEVRLTVDVTNSGTAPTDALTLRLISSGEVLGKVNLGPISPGATETETLTVTWPEGASVGIEAAVVHQGERTVSQVIYEVVVPETSQSVSIPWSGLLLGTAGGLVLVTVEAIRRRSPSKEKAPASQPESTSASSSASSPPAEKIEVACPSCDRRLRVPGDYSGAVRCPDCRERFDVEGPKEQTPASLPTEDRTEEPTKAPEKVEIGCPACSRKLRVPTEFYGRVRCPACKHEFSRAEAV